MKPLALIVEDTPDSALLFQRAVEAAGYDTEIAVDGIVAIERLAQIVPRLVVLDLHLPRLPGGTVLKSIRSSERLKNTYVIITTADPSLVDMLRDEWTLIFLKPVSFVQLKQIAERLRLDSK